MSAWAEVAKHLNTSGPAYRRARMFYHHPVEGDPGFVIQDGDEYVGMLAVPVGEGAPSLSLDAYYEVADRAHEIVQGLNGSARSRALALQRLEGMA